MCVCMSVCVSVYVCVEERVCITNTEIHFDRNGTLSFLQPLFYTVLSCLKGPAVGASKNSLSAVTQTRTCRLLNESILRSEPVSCMGERST